MRKPFIAGNWKMNMTTSDTKKMLDELIKFNLDEEIEVLICPPFTSIDIAHRILKDTKIKLGAQNVSAYEDGARTGEISTNMLKDLNTEYVIIGHSERRQYYGETDEIVNKKIKRALSQGLKVILCVGETEIERKNNIYKEKIKDELIKDLTDVNINEDLIIAYEPIWAIGTGKTCNDEDAEKMCEFIRNILKDLSNDISEKIRILYGGSVKPSNIKNLMKNPNIDGALVGGASLKAEDFSKLINFRKEV